MAFRADGRFRERILIEPACGAGMVVVLMRDVGDAVVELHTLWLRRGMGDLAHNRGRMCILKVGSWRRLTLWVRLGCRCKLQPLNEECVLLAPSDPLYSVKITIYTLHYIFIRGVDLTSSLL